MPTLPRREPVLRVVPMPADVNQHGDIFGGWIMSQVDIAGGIVAARRARGRVATVAVNEFTFKQPVSVGDVVTFYGEIARTGRTSVTIVAQIEDPLDDAVLTRTRTVLVCGDATGRPVPLPTSMVAAAERWPADPL